MYMRKYKVVFDFDTFYFAAENFKDADHIAKGIIAVRVYYNNNLTVTQCKINSYNGEIKKSLEEQIQDKLNYIKEYL